MKADDEFYRTVDAELLVLRGKLTKLETLLTLRGRLSSIQAMASSTDAPVPLRIKLIANVVCAKFEIRVQNIVARSRRTRADDARLVVFYLCVLEGFDKREVGRIFARSHSNVWYGFNSVRDRISVDAKFASLVESLKKLLALPVAQKSSAPSGTITITHRAA